MPLHGKLPLQAKIALAVEIMLAYVRARRTLRRADLPSTLAALRSGSTSASDAAAVHTGVRIGNATTRLLRALPADSRCLMTSLVVSRLLHRRGIESELIIGVKPGERFGAHAWVEIGGQPVLASGGDDFARLVAL